MASNQSSLEEGSDSVLCDKSLRSTVRVGKG